MRGHIFQVFFGLFYEPVKPSKIEDHSVETRDDFNSALCSNFCLLRKSCEHNKLFIWALVRALFQALLGALSAKRGQRQGTA